jgi:agmatine deiminase
MSTPRADGLAMPAEWAPHERTLMAWPCRRELWGEAFGRAKEEYAETANTIARFEPVTMVCRPGDGEEAGAMTDAEILELEIDDSWLRDSGPIYVVGEGGRAGVHFRFNAWGEKFKSYDNDATIGTRLLEHFGEPRYEAPLVLEGGSIAVDGEGTLLTTEQCLLHPSRNPDLTREQIEDALRDYLGVERIVWLGQGLVEDRDTDGHVDLIAAFVRPGHVLLQTAPPDNPNHANVEENKRRLEAAGLTWTAVETLPYAHIEGERVVAPALNFYLCNGGVVVPLAGTPEERDEALRTIADAYPDREVVGVLGEVLAYGGGGVHCGTQQVPAA